MAVNTLRFVGTGRPVNPQTNPRLDRQASRKGVLTSGVRNVGEFNQLIKSKLDVPPQQLGRNASRLPSGQGGGIDITA